MSNNLEGKKKCVIIGAGDLFDPRQVLGEETMEMLIGGEAFLIAVDGGMGYCRQAGLLPDLYIGDFDSALEADLRELEKIQLGCGQKNGQKSGMQEILQLPEEKDDTDMLAALKYGIEKGYREFYIYGGCGGRLDHTIANLQCLLYLKRRGCNGYLMQPGMKIWVLKDETMHFGAEQKGMLSLFSMNERACGVTIRGMKYPLDQYVMTNDFPIGISNEFIGQACSITVEQGEVLIMLQA